MAGKERKRFSRDGGWQRLITAAVVCAAFALLFLALGKTGYETNDDETLNLLYAGAYGSPTAYVIYQNIALGKVMAFLFGQFPSLNWYLLLMLGAGFLALTGITVVLSGDSSWPGTVLLAVCLNLLLGRQFYNELQFTKSASLYTAAGFLFLYAPFRRARPEEGPALFQLLSGGIPGILFLALGYAFRPESFLQALPFAAVLALGAAAGSGRRWLRTALLTALSCAAVIALLWGAHRAAYRSSEEWRSYLAYNRVRSDLLDFGLPRYNEHSWELEEAGFDADDLLLLTNWDYADPERFSREGLEELARIRGGKGSRLQFNRTSVHRACQAILDAVRSHLLCACSLLVLLLGVLIAGRREGVCLIAFLLTICGEYWYLSCMDRVVWRAEAGIWMVPMLFALGCLLIPPHEDGAALLQPSAGTTGRKAAPRRISGPGCLLAACFMTAVFTGSMLKDFYAEKNGQLRALGDSNEAFFREIRARNEAGDGRMLVLFDTPTLSSRPAMPDVYALTGAQCRGLYQDTVLLGGWAGLSPAGREYALAEGITNPLRALLEDERTYLVDNSGMADVILRYLRKHADPDAAMEEVETVAGFTLWKYRK